MSDMDPVCVAMKMDSYQLEGGRGAREHVGTCSRTANIF